MLIPADDLIAPCTQTQKDSPMADTTLMRAFSILSAIAGASGATLEEALALRDWILEAPDATIASMHGLRKK